MHLYYAFDIYIYSFPSVSTYIYGSIMVMYFN